jgi:hypothetical protein
VHLSGQWDPLGPPVLLDLVDHLLRVYRERLERQFRRSRQLVQ